MKPPLSLSLSRLASPLGDILIVSDADGRLRALDWATHEARMMRLLARLYGVGGVALTTAEAPPQIAAKLKAFFEGDLAAIDSIPVETSGTPFQREVWAALRQIPAGQTWSYGQLAQHIGRPAARRAVGAANGANPISVVVPCHRVIGADGTLTGYGGGIERKAWLLAHENAVGVLEPRPGLNGLGGG